MMGRNTQFFLYFLYFCSFLNGTTPVPPSSTSSSGGAFDEGSEWFKIILSEGMHSISRGDHAHAEKAFRILVRLNPHLFSVRFALASSLLQQCRLIHLISRI
jgi:hypothetical protein